MRLFRCRIVHNNDLRQISIYLTNRSQAIAENIIALPCDDDYRKFSDGICHFVPIKSPSHSAMRSRVKVKKNEMDIKSAASAYVPAMSANARE